MMSSCHCVERLIVRLFRIKLNSPLGMAFSGERAPTRAVPRGGGYCRENSKEVLKTRLAVMRAEDNGRSLAENRDMAKSTSVLGKRD